MYSLDSVWFQPPAGSAYVEQRLPGGDYLSTGYYPLDIAAQRGKGRTVEACTGVASLLFDCDLVGFLMAMRRHQEQEVPVKVKDQKALLYAAYSSDPEREFMLEELRRLVEPVVAVVLGGPATATRNSGWGLHFHLRVAGELATQKARLQGLAARAIAEMNRRVESKARAVYGIDWPASFDATHDVGARLARRPETVNARSGRPIAVAVLSEHAERELDEAGARTMSEALPKLPTSKATPKTPAAKAGAEPKAPAPRAGRHDRHHVDFRYHDWPDGGTWQDFVDSMQTEREDVVCPFGGTTKGSAFFKVLPSGRSFLVSNATSCTYCNTYTEQPPETSSDGRARGLTYKSDRQGRPTPVPETTTLNLLAILEGDSTWAFWYDLFRESPMDGTEELTDDIYIQVLETLERRYSWTRGLPGKDKVWSSILRTCRKHARDPVRDHLEGLEWDGTPRLHQWIHETIFRPGIVAGAVPEDYPLREYYEVLSRRWAIGLVARAMRPGCKLDTCLVLAGRQGFRKSTLFRMWCPFPDLFTDTTIDPRNKDAAITLAKSWLFEDAELASGKRSQEEQKKNFLSRQMDHVRFPYDRTTKAIKRHSVFVGTTNDRAFLRDATGSRRYWVVRCPQIDHLDEWAPEQPTADTAWLGEMRDELLAEALVAFRAGEPWHLSALEDRLRARTNEAFEAVTELDAAASAIYHANRGGLANHISGWELAHAVNPDMTKTDASRIGLSLKNAMARAGFVKHGQKDASTRRSRWYKPIPEGTQPMRGNGLDAVREDRGPVEDNRWGS